MNWFILCFLNGAIGSPVPGLDSLSQPNAKHPSKHDTLRPIQWGDLNFIHTTDTHGWLAGHILEREFSGDWGDFVSFGERMHEIADSKNADLILVDSGDRHDGNGLSDASKHDGSLALPIFCEADYDIVTIGNHELYRGVASLQEFRKIRKHYGDRYVVSNVELAVGNTWIPLGEKYRLFTTKNQNRTILAFGFLFNFEGNDKHTTRVTKVEDEMKKPWFQNLLRDVVPNVDYIVVGGHIPLRQFSEFDQILSQIRTVNKDVPVSMFGGHSHIRDYRKFDDRAVGLQSGRYVETIGWASVNLTNNGPIFSRSYIDFNQRTMAYHSGTDEPSERGKRISKDIAKARKLLNLDDHRAEVPQNYYTDRAPFPSRNSIYSLLQEKVLPMLNSPTELQNHTRYVILNTGAIRFDLFKGPYTKDTGYILSPFKNEWFYISGVPRQVADQVLPFINGLDRVTLAFKSCEDRESPLTSAHGDEFDIESQNIHDLGNDEQLQLHSSKRPSFGYCTIDDAGDDGDDTIHTPWKFHHIPNAFQSVIEGTEDNDSVDLIFHDFVASFIENALSKLGHGELYKPAYHGGEEVIDLLPAYFNSQTKL